MWFNPVPVPVVLVPVVFDPFQNGGLQVGLLMVRRGIEPGAGRLALPGGFLEDHETWEQAATREVLEEASVVIDPGRLRQLSFASSAPRPNRVLLFAEAPVVDFDRLPMHRPSREAPERGIVQGPGGLDDVMAFPLHAAAARAFFAERHNTRRCDYVVV